MKNLFEMVGKQSLRTIFLFLMLQTGIVTLAQIGINDDGSNPKPSALLDVKSSDKGVLLPRLTTTQRDVISSPAIGLIIYNTDINTLQIFSTGGWLSFENESCAPAKPEIISGDSLVCDNQTGLTYSITSVLGAAGYHWAVPPGATIIGGQNTISITANMGTQSGDVRVRAESNCGNSAYSTLLVAVGSPDQPGSITGNDSPCENQTGYTYSIEPVLKSTVYNWTVPSGANIVSGQGSTDITMDFGTSNGNVSVRAENFCGVSSYQDFAIILNSIPNPPGNINGPVNVNLGTTHTYSINPVSGATSYTWTVPAGALIISGQGTVSVGVLFMTIGSFYVEVQAENICGNSNPTNMPVSVVP